MNFLRRHLITTRMFTDWSLTERDSTTNAVAELIVTRCLEDNDESIMALHYWRERLHSLLAGEFNIQSDDVYSVSSETATMHDLLHSKKSDSEKSDSKKLDSKESDLKYICNIAGASSNACRPRYAGTSGDYSNCGISIFKLSWCLTVRGYHCTEARALSRKWRQIPSTCWVWTFHRSRVWKQIFQYRRKTL